MLPLCLLLILPSLVHPTEGAELMDAKRLLQGARQKRGLSQDPVTSLLQKRDVNVTMKDLEEETSLGKDTKLEVTKTVTTAQGTKLVRLQETFKGQPVSDGVVTVETDSNEDHVMDVSGTVVTNIDDDTDGIAKLDNQSALVICLRNNSDQEKRESIIHPQVTSKVFHDGKNKAYLGYLVQYLLKGERKRPSCIIDARNGDVKNSWNAMTTYKGKGTGGNLGIGKIKYGQVVEALDVQFNGSCFLENEYVRVIDNYGSEVEWNETQEDPASYNCTEIDDFVNGGYSPLLDAMHYGTIVGRMYKEWYNMKPLKDKMIFRVHYGLYWDNAAWNGHECLYGDGSEENYPLVTLDTVAHEVAHGITEQNSGLYDFGQAGGLNEAFSDIAGETAEFFQGKADWLHGMDHAKDDAPDRFLEDQSFDGNSIIHVSKWTDRLNSHYASGVFNRVFYLLVHDYKQPAKEIFNVFLTANLMFWQSATDYVRGACDVMKAAYDRGQDGALFRKAFAEVGIDVCDVSDHIVPLKSDTPVENITVSKNIKPTFTLGVVGFLTAAYGVTAESPDGGVYITVSDKVWGTEGQNVKVYGEGVFGVYIKPDFDEVRFVTIELSTDSDQELTNVRVEALERCRENYPVVQGDKQSEYQHGKWKELCGDNGEEE